jgi:hypothetical protein
MVLPVQDAVHDAPPVAPVAPSGREADPLRDMAGAIRTNAAAAMLGVAPSTLRAWERRFGFPEPARTAGGHRQYDLAEVEALRAAFAQTGDVAVAVTMARDRGAGPASDARLQAALLAFDETAADRLMEESLALRSVERTVGEVLLPGVAGVAQRAEGPTAELAFAWRWATCWLSAAVRVAPPATREAGVLVLDAAGQLDVDALRAQALELALRRGGLRTLTLAASVEPVRLGHALRALRPRALVLAGRGLGLDAVARLVFTARQTAGPGLAVLDLGGALPTAGASIVAHLPGDDPAAAREILLAHVEEAPDRRFGAVRAVGQDLRPC